MGCPATRGRQLIARSGRPFWSLPMTVHRELRTEATHLRISSGPEARDAGGSNRSGA